nr:MAG: hypothetical protein BECKFM1743C_GA0114222_101004 [Candidatus Kentron sp. FM]
MGRIVVILKDSSTGELIRDDVEFFNTEWTPVSVNTTNIDNAPAISVLAINSETSKAKMQIRDAMTGLLLNGITY